MCTWSPMPKRNATTRSSAHSFGAAGPHGWLPARTRRRRAGREAGAGLSRPQDRSHPNRVAPWPAVAVPTAARQRPRPLARHSVSSAGNTRAAAVTVRRSAIRTGRHGGRGVSPARELRRSAGRLGFEGGGATPRQFQCCTLGKLALSTKGAPDRASGRARSGARSPA